MKSRSTIYLLLFFTLVFYNKYLCQSPIPVIQTGHSGGINDVSFINDNEFITAGEDGKIVFWDILTGAQKSSFQAHTGNIEKIKITKQYIITCSSAERNVKIWDHSFNLIETVGPFGTPIKSFDYLEDLNQIYIGGDYLYRYHFNNKDIDTLKILSANFFETVTAHDNKVLVGGSFDNHATLIDAKNLNKIGIFKQITAAGFSNQNMIYLGGRYGNMKAYSLEDRKTKSLSLQSSYTRINKVQEVGDFIIIGDSDGKLEVRNKVDFSILHNSNLHNKSLQSFAISPDNNFIITVGVDGKIFYREIATGWLVKSFMSTCAPILDIKKFGLSNYALIYEDGSLRVWDIVTNIIHSKKLLPNKLQTENNWHFLVDEILNVDNEKMLLSLYKVKTADDNPNQAIKIEKWQAQWNYLSQELYIEKQREKLEVNPSDIHWKKYLMSNLKKSKREQIRSIFGDEFVSSHPKVNNFIIDERSGLVSLTDDDGIISFYDFTSKKHLCKIALLGYNDFIYLDSSNYYFASKGALNFVGFKVDNQMISFQQFDIYFNRPDIVLEKLPFVSKEFVGQLYKAVEKRHLKLRNTSKEIPSISELPTLKIDINDIKKTQNATFTFVVDALSKNELEKLNVLINGVPVFDVGGIEIYGKQFKDSITIDLHSGLNSVDVYVEDTKGYRSLTLSFDIESLHKEEKPDIYIVSIGASRYVDCEYNLKYADKDALEIAKLFKKNKIFRKNNELILINEDVSIENIKKVERFIASSKIQDVVLFFIAGHGVLDANYNYYLASHEMDFMNPSDKGIPYEMITDIFKNVKSRQKVILLDACHSGEIDTSEVVLSYEPTENNEQDIQFRAAGINVKSTEFTMSSLDLSKALFADVSDSDGSTVISSASGTEYAMESTEWKNGLFTYCLIEGIRTQKADLNSDKTITINELRRYINNSVQELSQGKQNPSSRIENIKNDFVIFKK